MTLEKEDKSKGKVQVLVQEIDDDELLAQLGPPPSEERNEEPKEEKKEEKLKVEVLKAETPTKSVQHANDGLMSNAEGEELEVRSSPNKDLNKSDEKHQKDNSIHSADLPQQEVKEEEKWVKDIEPEKTPAPETQSEPDLQLKAQAAEPSDDNVYKRQKAQSEAGKEEQAEDMKKEELMEPEPIAEASPKKEESPKKQQNLEKENS